MIKVVFQVFSLSLSLSLSLSPLSLSLPPLKVTNVKAQCVYLRAFYQLCHHEILNALDNFFDTLQRLEVNLVPDYKYVKQKKNCATV